MGTFKRIYQSLVFMQTILLFCFLLQNINNLNQVHFTFNIGGNTLSFTLNLYAVLVVMGVIFGLIILAGLNIFNVGLNDESTKNVAKYVSIFVIFGTLNLATAFYMLQFGWLGLVIQIFLLLIYLLYSIGILNESSETN